jgi:hypothetical protein
MRDEDETTQLEPTHSLVLSSLRFWEVERDLIEERIAAINQVTVPLRGSDIRDWKELSKSRVEV